MRKCVVLTGSPTQIVEESAVNFSLETGIFVMVFLGVKHVVGKKWLAEH